MLVALRIEWIATSSSAEPVRATGSDSHIAAEVSRYSFKMHAAMILAKLLVDHTS
jgi:hypothetical protein